ncbi:MAG: hypothetical protein ACI8WT_003697 [Clostridium sp.]|jgi:hypothetical protein
MLVISRNITNSNIHDYYFYGIYYTEVLNGGFVVTKITLKIERHYGNENLKIIIENLISVKLTNLKFNSEAYDKSYYNIDTNIKDTHQEAYNL